MSLIMGYIKDLDIAVPLTKEIRIEDREGVEHRAWLIDLAKLDEPTWGKLLADMRKRFPDAPKDDLAFRSMLLDQGLPIREERVQVVYDMRGFL